MVGGREGAQEKEGGEWLEGRGWVCRNRLQGEDEKSTWQFWLLWAPFAEAGKGGFHPQGGASTVTTSRETVFCNVDSNQI